MDFQDIFYTFFYKDITNTFNPFIPLKQRTTETDSLNGTFFDNKGNTSGRDHCRDPDLTLTYLTHTHYLLNHGLFNVSVWIHLFRPYSFLIVLKRFKNTRFRCPFT